MEEIIQYYKSGKCPFCNHVLLSEHDNGMIRIDEVCKNTECDVDYSLMLDVAYFIIDGIRFVVYANESNMTAIANDEGLHYSNRLMEYLVHPKALIITKSNYRQQVERIKKLQAFS